MTEREKLIKALESANFELDPIGSVIGPIRDALLYLLRKDKEGRNG